MQTLIEQHQVDDQGNPSGGTTEAVGLKIEWQDGPLGQGDDVQPPNGTFVETLIEAAIGRLKFYQTAKGGEFSCRENAITITKLEEALHWQLDRTRTRETRGVEGTHTA